MAVERVDVPPVKILALAGEGSPGSPDHMEAYSIMFALANEIKSQFEKHRSDQEYVMMPLEGLWWTRDGSDWQQANDEDRRWMDLLLGQTMTLSSIAGCFRFQVTWPIVTPR